MLSSAFISANVSARPPWNSEVFFKIKINFFSGYFDPVNLFFDNKNK